MTDTILRNTLIHIAEVASQFQSGVGLLEPDWFLAEDVAAIESVGFPPNPLLADVETDPAPEATQEVSNGTQ